MIQGCRYLRRSTDRWLLSKNSMTRLEGLESWHEAGLLWNCSILLQTLRVHIYTLVLTRLLVDHDYNIYCLKLIPRRQCPSRTRHQFVPSLYSSHVITHSRMLSIPSVKQLFCRKWWRTPDRRCLYRILWGKPSAEWYSSTKLGPQVSLPCTNFWC
jgi:hypothetical protein